jgi:hypothetical protein
MLSCLSGPLSASFWPFLTLKASHVRKNEWLYEENKYVIRVNILYRLVPQLTPLDFYFPRCVALTGTKWCAYWGDEKNIFFSKFFFGFSGKSTSKKTISLKKLGFNVALVS